MREGYDDSYCVDAMPNWVNGLSPTRAVDYVGLQSFTNYQTGVESWMIQESGTACVTDDSNCRDVLAAAPTEGILIDRFMADVGKNYARLLTTSAADAQALFTLDEVKAFLGTVDTPSEALLLTYLNSYTASCFGPNISEAEGGGFIIYVEKNETCLSDVYGYRIHVKPDGALEVLESAVVVPKDDNCSIGRIPGGLTSAVSCEDEGGLGAFWARAAHLEAASVAAFERLARELRAHGAPEELVEAALRSAREETRHALLTGALARRHGAARPVPVVENGPVRTLEEIALENAVEGLVRETYGALVAHHQARHAGDEMTRRVVQSIAVDETRHAEFSWELHEWLVARLDTGARARVEAAHRRAIDAFEESFVREPSEEVRRAAGLPTESAARQLYSALRRELWDAA